MVPSMSAHSSLRCSCWGCVIVKGPMKWALLALTVFSILLAWGKHAMAFTDIMLAVAPMYAKFQCSREHTRHRRVYHASARRHGIAAACHHPRQLCTLPPSASVVFRLTLALCVIGMVAPGVYGSALPTTTA